MVKLNNNEMDNVSGGVSIQENNGKWEVIKTIETFEDEESAKRFVADLADKGADLYGHHKHRGCRCCDGEHKKPPMGPKE